LLRSCGFCRKRELRWVIFALFAIKMGKLAYLEIWKLANEGIAGGGGIGGVLNLLILPC